MVEVSASEIDELLASHGITRSASGGCDSGMVVGDGKTATVRVTRIGTEALMNVSIDGDRVIDVCPLDRTRAIWLAEHFRRRASSSHDPIFEHMFANLLTKLSDLYFDSEAASLVCESVQLHRTSYRIGAVRLQRLGDRHVVLDQRAG